MHLYYPKTLGQPVAIVTSFFFLQQIFHHIFSIIVCLYFLNCTLMKKPTTNDITLIKKLPFCIRDD